jgi:hypothetical protein
LLGFQRAITIWIGDRVDPRGEEWEAREFGVITPPKRKLRQLVDGSSRTSFPAQARRLSRLQLQRLTGMEQQRFWTAGDIRLSP